MTTQSPDSCTFEGRRWEITRWDGSTDSVPTNEQLGFRTVTQSTANWSGRIDHFLIHRRTLYLFKIEVTLAPENKGILPFGSRREVVRRFEQMEVHGDGGMRMEERERRIEYLVFDDLIIPFTGWLHLSYPYFDFWEVPWPIGDEAEAVVEQLELELRDGILA